MTYWLYEFRLIARSRLQLAALALLCALSGVAVWSGLHEVERQQQTIERLAPLHDADVAALVKQFETPGDPGKAAYYTFYNIWDAPSNAAFLALGLRDSAPYVQRIRALGLQAQIYEGERFNPELVLPGRFDYAFVLIYLAPLFIIALMHDLISGEREAGRLRLLLALPGATDCLWRRRAGLRLALVFTALALPITVGAILSSTPVIVIGAVLLTTIAYLLIWASVSLLVGMRGWSSAANATALVGAWAVLTLALPALATIALNRAIPVPQGTELMLAQREHVHGAWERPREDTMTAFYRGHPEWKDSPPLPQGFHYKWYFAFHQVGDESVADEVAAYRAGLLARQKWTERLGWVLPGVGTQTILHRLAATDLTAQLDWQDQVSAFHEKIRRFYYDYLFTDTRFGTADFDKRPVFAPQMISSHGWGVSFAMLALLMAVLSTIAISRLHSLQRPYR